MLHRSAGPSFREKAAEQTAEARSTTIIRIVDHLRVTRQAISFNDLKLKFSLPRDDRTLQLLIEELQRHEAVVADLVSIPPTFAYKSRVAIKYGRVVTSAATLEELCVEHPEGVLRSDLEDAYQVAKDHITELLTQGRLLEFKNTSNRNNSGPVIFPAAVASAGTVFPAHIRDMWNKVELPSSMAEIEKALTDAGHSVLARASASATAAARQGQIKRGFGAGRGGKKDGGLLGRKLVNKHMANTLFKKA